MRDAQASLPCKQNSQLRSDWTVLFTRQLPNSSHNCFLFLGQNQSLKVKNNKTLALTHSGLIIQCHTDTPYRQDPNLGEDKGGLLGPKKDKYKVCSLLNKAPPNFGSSAAFSCQFCQALRYQNRSKGLVWHYIQ